MSISSSGSAAFPSADELAVRGLFNATTIERPPSSLSPALRAHSSSSTRKPPTADWMSGWATLVPQPNYPLLEDRPKGANVRFHFCPAGDPNSASNFRRQAQVEALDTVSSSAKRAATSNGSSSSTLTVPNPRHYRPPSTVLAWWEDDLGLWFVLEASHLSYTPFTDVWHDIVGAGWPEQCSPDEKGLAVEKNWAAACDLLLRAVQCLQALHDRQMSLNWCHPDCFGVTGGQVVINRLWGATALPGLSLPPLITPALAASALFTREALHHSTCNLSEAYIFRHLRYLAPEAAISRRVSPSNDIYSWGVLAYELVTGTTIDGGPDSPDLSEIDLLADIHKHITHRIRPPLETLKRVAEIGSVELDMPPKQLSDIIMLALAKDPEDRYNSFDALVYDLRKLSQICRARGDLSKFTPGEVDRISRFSLPPTVIERESQLEALDAAFAAVAQGTASSRVINVWGNSGNGKTRLVDEWASNIEVSDLGNKCLLGWAKPDEHVKKPLASFVQIFQSLLDRVLTDPREDAKDWLDRIRTALGSQWAFFASLLSRDCRRLIGEETMSHAPAIEWEKFLAAFRSWSCRFLQLFATRARPLILVIDDTQWLAQDEVDVWRDIIDGATPLNYALIVTMTRSEALEPPPQASSLSASTTSVPVHRLTEEGVAQFINTCLKGRVASSSQAIASFLYGETDGNPLFLQTLMTTLLKEQVVSFDYGSLQWRFNLVALQAHLSDASFDAYLENVMRRQSSDVQDMLKFLSNLPSSGFPLSLLSSAIGKTFADTDNVVQAAVSSGSVTLRGDIVRFTHDRQRLAAQRLIAEDEQGRVHEKIFQLLSRPDLVGDYLFDAMEQALAGRKLGIQVTSDVKLLPLLLDATQRAATSASFKSAKHFAERAGRVLDNSGGIAAWIKRDRALTFRYVRLSTDLSTVFHDHDAAFKMLETIMPLCQTSTEKIVTATLLVKQLIAANRPLVAIDRLLETLDEFGYHPEHARAVPLWHPERPEDVLAFDKGLSKEPPDPDDERVLILSLLAFAGPTIYVTQPQRRYAFFELGISIAKQLGHLHESMGYLTVAHAVTISNAPVQHALLGVARRIALTGPVTYLRSSTLIAIGCLAPYFDDFTAVSELLESSFDASLGQADHEVASYVVGLDLGVRLFAKSPVSWEPVLRRYELIKSYMTTSHQLFINIELQYGECLARPPNAEKPWLLDGIFYRRRQIENSLRLQHAIYDTLTLRLQLLYEAPKDVLEAGIKAARKTLEASEGLIFAIEARWLMALAALRCKTNYHLVEDGRAFLAQYAPFSPDIRMRLDFLNVTESITKDVFEALPEAEAVIQRFDEESRYLLSGWLNADVAFALLEATGSPKLSAGFIRGAFDAYRLAEAYGMCELVRKKYPDVCSSMVLNVRGPREYFSVGDFAADNMSLGIPNRRASYSTISDTTTASSQPITEPNEPLVPNENLDTLALMRSSLALAQEKDGLVLMCTLLRILCQFARCDYAAIGLSDEDDRSTLRLKAAGPFHRIVSYDLDVSDDAAQNVCPTGTMLHVARTGVPISQPSKMSRLRHDPFYRDRQPRTVLCLPIINQGVQSGVILLLSMSSASAAIQSESAREVVSTLATFAYIIHLHHVFTSRLKTEVAQRTRELTSALQAKTQFLSQCSHELRSPLAAIMGLTAVLEASPGLTAVQREHLQTITASGQDLLSLISNILDHSKLESNSVQLEHIPFQIRDVIESALDIIAPVAQTKNVELTVVTVFQNDPPGLVGDPFRIKQVLLNLLSNAVKFTPPSSGSKRSARVTVERSWEELDNDRIRISLTVADTGVGIPASKMGKLFKSFSQVDSSITRSYGGSGLGLVISRDLARLLGGDCTVESEFGKGSKFTFTFLATRDPNWKPTALRRFSTPKQCFVLSPQDMVWGSLLNEDLGVFNCVTTLFTDNVHLALEKDRRGGLNCGVAFDILLLDAASLDRNTLNRMRALQPKAKFLYVARATEIARQMSRLQIPRESILSRPLKFKSLHDTVVPPAAEPERKPSPTVKPGINRELAKEMPLEILVVDDSAVNVAVCRRILELYGYNNADAAADGMQAVEAAEKKKYDMILLDLQMPVLDGFGALERIRDSPLAGDPCCVSLSANVDKATQDRCIEAGFFSVLSKPVDIPRLGEIIFQVYHHRKGMVPHGHL